MVEEAAGGPVTAALRAAAEVTGRIEVVTGPVGDGWLLLRDLARPGRLDRFVDAAGAFFGGCPTAAARTAAATLMVGDVVSAFAVPIAAMLTTQQRALVLDPDDVALRLGADGVDGVATNAPALAVVAGDPIAGPDVRVAGDLSAVRRTAIQGYADLLAPLLDLVPAAARRGRHAIWADATDRLASAVHLTLRAVDQPERAPDEVARLLAVAPDPLRRRIGWVDVPVGDRTVPWKRRTVCCLAYQTPRWAGDVCATCPLTPPEETVRRIAESLTP
jgi:hypothetical protein